MNKKINILENKKLVLKSVIKKSLNKLPSDQIDKEVQKFQNVLLSHNLSIFGPLVICNKGSHISETGSVTVDIDIIVQAREYKKMKALFDIEETHICSGCILAQFEGDAENIQFAYSKLDVFIYENNLVSTGLIYTLYKNSSVKHTCLDIFKKVENL